MDDEKESVGGNGGGCIDQQIDAMKRALNYGGRFGGDQLDERLNERFAEIGN
jgi:hypothetical protein